MALLIESVVFGLLVIVITFCFSQYRKFTRNFDYWKKRNVPYCKPRPFFGNFKDRILFRKALGEVWVDLYQELDGQKLGGVWMMQAPLLFIRDPDIIKNVLAKDFSHFTGRGTHVDEKGNPLSAHLFNLSGAKWRVLRTKMTPTFTSGKMKMMLPLMKECAEELVQFVSQEIRTTQEVEFKEAFSKFATDVIGTCAFGLQFNSMKNPDSEFRAMGRKVFAPSKFGTLLHILSQFSPSLAKIFRARSPPEDVSEFFLNVVHETIEYRERNNVKRNDFLQLLIELKSSGKVEDGDHDSNISNGIPFEKSDPQDFEVTNNLLAAQAFVFFLAGFETSSTTMSFALHELSVNPDVQEKLRNEIDNILEETNGALTYESLQKMDYMEKVINESMRKYPPVAAIVRKCNESYCEPITGVTVDTGTMVQIPVYAIHHDPEYFPDPERFDPERFSEEEKAKRHNYVYLPFGEGPRICIGIRFAMLQMKLGLAALLSRFEASPSARSPLPLQLDARGCITASQGGVWVRLRPRERASPIPTLP